MAVDNKIVILPARGCRRSRRIIQYLEEHNIPFTRVELESSEGQRLAKQYGLRASPGILVNGASINPFDLLRPGCRVDGKKARAIFTGAGTDQGR